MNKNFVTGYILGGLITGGIVAATAFYVVKEITNAQEDLLVYLVDTMSPHVPSDILKEMDEKLAFDGLMLFNRVKPT